METLCRWMDGEKVSREELDRDFCRIPSLKNLNDRDIDWKNR